MREISRETDPQAMVARYGSGMQRIARRDRLVALSRRGLEAPRYRITRSDLWSTAVDPWKDPERLPEFDRGVLGELLHAGEARVIEHLSVPEDDPAAEYFRGMGSAITVPTWDDGEVLNMVVMMRREPGGYRPEELPQAVWMANLFGRATRNLVLRNQLDAAYARLDEELQVVARIQRDIAPVGPGLCREDRDVVNDINHQTTGSNADRSCTRIRVLEVISADRQCLTNDRDVA